MIDQTLVKIEERLRASASLSEERRSELLELFGQLRREMAELDPSHGEAAKRIAGVSERSATVVTEGSPDRTQLQESLDHLADSVSGFEESHPKLVQVVNRICTTLSSLGI